MVNLCKVEDLAEEAGLPAASLRTAAEQHGFLIRMGRAIRIDRDQYPELLKKCQDSQRGQGSISSSTGQTGTSATPASRTRSENTGNALQINGNIGAPERIRTSGLCLRRALQA